MGSCINRRVPSAELFFEEDTQKRMKLENTQNDVNSRSYINDEQSYMDKISLNCSTDVVAVTPNSSNSIWYLKQIKDIPTVNEVWIIK